ncbi:hypothetical protein B9N43_03185 [Denitratisoma sp. DHT3]|nr:hypothetical protein B9N43_03185 [Denitratisoma sp. DHT3]
MKPIARLFEDTFGPVALLAAPKVPPTPHRRLRIWQLPSTWHCPLIGTCLTIAELRQLARRAGFDESRMPDYVLHSAVVGHCDERTEIAELIQRFLDRRYAASIQQFAQAKGSDAVLALWRVAYAEGRVEGSLWAAWTHPDTNDYTGTVIYGEMHMLSHRLGATERTEKQRLHTLEQDSARLHEEIATLRQNLLVVQQERDRSVILLEGRLAESERKVAQCQREAAVVAAAEKLKAANAALHERNEALGERLAASQSLIADLEDELAQTRHVLRKTVTPLEATALPGTFPVSAADHPDGPAEVRLNGYRILCIGGRPGLIDHYRRLVEAGGGHFLHHDGGLEDNEHRIDAAVAGADAVVCQIGHISHSAYWRIKQACKQQEMPCIFQKSAGVTTFARSLEMLALETSQRRTGFLVTGKERKRHDHLRR